MVWPEAADLGGVALLVGVSVLLPSYSHEGMNFFSRRFSFARKSIFVVICLFCLLVAVLLAVIVDFDAIPKFLFADDLSQLTPAARPSCRLYFNEVEDLSTNDALSSKNADISWAPFNIEFRNLNCNYSMLVQRALPSSSPDAGGSSDNGANICPASTKMLVLVQTRPDAFERRAIIRKSWAKRNLARFAVRFVMGKSRDPTLSAALIDELRSQNDLIINDIPDSYKNLYFKVYSSLQWQQTYCSGVEYVLKVDDDTVIDLGRLAFWLEEEFAAVVRGHPLAAFGYFVPGAIPNRNSTHRAYVPEEDFPGATFPKYVAGGMYLLTTRAVEAILTVAPQFNAFTAEDALFTGVLAGGAGVHQFDATIFIRNLGINKIYEGELCDHRNEPFILSLFNIPDQLGLTRYEEMRNAKCDNKPIADADWPLLRKI